MLYVMRSVADTHMASSSSHVKWTDKASVSLAAIALFVAGASAWIFESQLKEMRRTTEASTRALEIDERAWVSADSWGKVVFEPGKDFQTEITFRNTGKSPAKNVQIWSHLRPIAKGDVPNFDVAEGPPGSQGLMPPKGEFHRPIFGAVTGRSGLSAGGFNSIASGAETVFVFGIVRYEDVFGFKHWATFCSRFEPLSRQFEICETHNEIDEEPR